MKSRHKRARRWWRRYRRAVRWFNGLDEAGKYHAAYITPCGAIGHDALRLEALHGGYKVVVTTMCFPAQIQWARGCRLWLWAAFVVAVEKQPERSHLVVRAARFGRLLGPQDSTTPKDHEDLRAPYLDELLLLLAS